MTPVMANVVNPVANANRAAWACAGNVPLPPLKGVRWVRKSKPLLKSKYSFKALTLICAAIAPMSIKTMRKTLTCADFQAAVPIPSKTQQGVRSKNGRRIGPKRTFSSVIAVSFEILLVVAFHIIAA
jgi:hypothetical protein